MNVFHHGGRIGDCIYALWTMKALGGGRLVLTDFQKGNWSLKTARSMKRFLLAQEYVEGVDICPYGVRGSIDYDLHDAENDYNPEAFGMSREEPWPGRASIAGRYAKHFGLEFDGRPWLTVPESRLSFRSDVTFHCPVRRSVRKALDWQEIVVELAERGLDVTVLGDEPPLHNQMQPDSWDLMDSAMYVAGSKVFLGVVSCCNALAEGLGVPRLIEQASDCFNVGEPAVRLNGWSNAAVVAEVMRWAREGKSERASAVN